MPLLLSGGRVTPAPEAPTVLNTCQTPTEGLPGSPTVAIGIVTTPRLATGSDELEVVLDVVADELDDEPHAVAPTESATSRATKAGCCHRLCLWLPFEDMLSRLLLARIAKPALTLRA